MPIGDFLEVGKSLKRCTAAAGWGGVPYALGDFSSPFTVVFFGGGGDKQMFPLS